ncbi:hypothetical protein ACA910_013822 [Epithemia clementina (nom. ined.)]
MRDDDNDSDNQRNHFSFSNTSSCEEEEKSRRKPWKKHGGAFLVETKSFGLGLAAGAVLVWLAMRMMMMVGGGGAANRDQTFNPFHVKNDATFTSRSSTNAATTTSFQPPSHNRISRIFHGGGKLRPKRGRSAKSEHDTKDSLSLVRTMPRSMPSELEELPELSTLRMLPELTTLPMLPMDESSEPLTNRGQHPQQRQRRRQVSDAVSTDDGHDWISCPLLPPDLSVESVTVVLQNYNNAGENFTVSVRRTEMSDTPPESLSTLTLSLTNTTTTAPPPLCILAIWTQTVHVTTMTATPDRSVRTPGALTPMARSYHGYDWEPYSHAVTDDDDYDSEVSYDQLDVHCPSRDGCHLTLPPLVDPVSQVYVLSSYRNVYTRQEETSSSSSSSSSNSTIDDPSVEDMEATHAKALRLIRNEYARFLEQATFGVTRKDLQSLLEQHRTYEANSQVSLSSATTTSAAVRRTTRSVMAQWVQEQQTLVPPSLHRAYFRQHLNAPFRYSNEYGIVSHPCGGNNNNNNNNNDHGNSLFTSYRQWTFSGKQYYQFVYIDPVGEQGHRALQIRGMVWTVVPGPLFHAVRARGANTTYVQYPDKKGYQICSSPGDGVGSEFRLKSPVTSDCEDVIIGDPNKLSPAELMYGNPPIQFTAGVAPSNLIVLDDARPGTIKVAEADQAFFAPEKEGDPPQVIQLAHPLDHPVCRQVTYSSWDDQNDPGAITVVFGMYQGTYYVHHPQFLFQENTLEKPLFDGGGSLVKLTRASTPESSISKLSSADLYMFQTKCSNVPRTFVNEEYCVLSTSYESCVPSGLDLSSLTGDFGHGAVVCGSPGEVANDLRLSAGRGGAWYRGAFDIPTAEFGRFGLDAEDYTEQRRIVWTALSLGANDQLRQRVAWALYQLLVISAAGITSNRDQAEDFLAYYDIFVRHAFGNFRSVLKEVTFSRMMGEMLTYANSQSTGYQWLRATDETISYPDENFAREVMQLFTIGLFKLNQDGTPKRHSDGRPINTYSNKQIVEFSRVWTGFRAQNTRGNGATAVNNRIDPMTIVPEWRDVFPKLGLNDQYIGHGYPLCADLPRHDFLKRGAKYRLLGYSSRPELQEDPSEWLDRPDEVWFVANKTTGTSLSKKTLYTALCNAEIPTYGESAPCTYPAVVTLSENLDCNGVDECNVDSVRTVKVDDVFYEYLRPPCVYQSFYENARKIKIRPFMRESMYMCADPRTDVAAAACCLGNGADQPAYANTLYWGERVKLSTAQDRCQAKAASDDPGFALCTFTGPATWAKGWGFASPYLWFGETPCFVKAKIDRQGKVAVVHSVPDEDPTAPRERQLTDEDSKTFFGVVWSDPSEAKSFVRDCAEPCEKTQDGYCMCSVYTTDEIVFETSMPTRKEVLSELAIGAFHPDAYELPFVKTTTGDNVTVYTILSTGERVFEVIDDFGVVQRRKNLQSTVYLFGSSLSFPNPVHFMSLAEPATRDALYETDAAIDQLFYHENTAPFIAQHFAQRFGQSNPSLRYVEVIANAFRTGRYCFDDGKTACAAFGEGKYGDLAATIAATLLDREAREVILDGDPAYGSMKEPILKVLGTMRNFEFQSTLTHPLPRFRVDLQTAIGQMVFEAQSIFSFFNPENQPRGVVSIAGMVSPEAEIHASPNIISMLNGLMSMMKYGLDECWGGFGYSVDGHDDCESRIAGQYTNSSGYLSYLPTSLESVVDELATLMTSGRLHPRKREWIDSVVKNESDILQATIKAQQLIATTPEFHATGTVGVTSQNRKVKTERKVSKHPYKATVVLMLRGGLDSYNLVVPHKCSVTNAAGQTVDKQYMKVRGSVAMNRQDRNVVIDAPNSGQPCEEFAIHNEMSSIRDLYNEESLCFFMNTGLILQPVTKDNYELTEPPGLFSHNKMQNQVDKVDPFNKVMHTGFLGRLVETLNGPSYNFSAHAIGINIPSPALYGDPRGDSLPPLIVSENGPERFNIKPQNDEFEPWDLIEKLNGVNKITSNFHGDSWSENLIGAVKESDFLADKLESDDVSLPCRRGYPELNMVVKMMQTREARGSDRDVFFVEVPSFDHHQLLNERLDRILRALDRYISCYVENLKALNLWDNVTTVVMSEFGRTLIPNNNDGTDHGWGGHYFAFGGALRRGKRKFIGEYPADLTPDGPYLEDRGRVIPTTAWETVLAPIIEWMGASAKDIVEYVLPNIFRAGGSSGLVGISELFGHAAAEAMTPSQH